MGKLREIASRAEIVALDTSCLIYYLEGSPLARELGSEVFLPLEQGAFRAVISTLALAELLVRPASLGRGDACGEYLALLCSYPNLEVVPLTTEIAVRCAHIRAKHRTIRTPDAIHLATAAERGAKVFLTNDSRLPPEVGEVEVIVLGEILRR
ncbi:MAG: PIN domain-containing protein [Candidatus Fermentithermobacillus carboniphilus]|uniref:Ribonuclease VapC n=1 Tax=Candidatus Fermentithermobacillus carboniphilus TaxID=3085328 RepID=A0AAT9LBQ0_9FIRM|nr:MAG: PIN domain-containing protein [Candidatus Fermentithermobacillus carboniphilus]